MNILVTGGAGYIGSYVVDLLIDKYNVIVVDDLSTGSIEAVNKKAKFYEIDICDYEKLNSVFKDNHIDGVIHFAAKLNVEESSRLPLDYYETNVAGTSNLLRCMVNNKVNSIVFSSTAAIYGERMNDDKITEEEPTAPVNNYGLSKLMGEQIIEAANKAHNINYISFRYFNVAGGRKIGWPIERFSTLIPRIISSVKNNIKLEVYGNDYPTSDGTCIRDYIHVIDLAKAHIVGLEKIMNNNDISGIYNLGSSKGFSVLEVINTTAKVLNKKVDYTITARRIGDPYFSVASSLKAKEILGWETEINNLDDIILDMWQNNQN
ncbi:MAG: UDP-glucose 4-epimerase GalE [Bacilli bacterium]|jgi:UDP-glucose 4-epimerase|nr:UDP-glucose 4-epimerase GalE [Bacilli bacterium]